MVYLGLQHAQLDELEIVDGDSGPMMESRSWRDGHRVPGGPTDGDWFVTRFWRSDLDRVAYWLGERPIAESSLLGPGASVPVTIDPRKWIAGTLGELPCDGLDFGVEFRITGFAVSDCECVERVGFVGGFPRNLDDSESVDFGLGMDARLFALWLAGAIAIRDVADRIAVEGDPLMLGALAGVVGAPALVRRRLAFCHAVLVLADLVQLHASTVAGREAA